MHTADELLERGGELARSLESAARPSDVATALMREAGRQAPTVVVFEDVHDLPVVARLEGLFAPRIQGCVRREDDVVELLSLSAESDKAEIAAVATFSRAIAGLGHNLASGEVTHGCTLPPDLPQRVANP